MQGSLVGPPPQVELLPWSHSTQSRLKTESSGRLYKLAASLPWMPHQATAAVHPLMTRQTLTFPPPPQMYLLQKPSRSRHSQKSPHILTGHIIDLSSYCHVITLYSRLLISVAFCACFLCVNAAFGDEQVVTEVCGSCCAETTLLDDFEIAEAVPATSTGLQRLSANFPSSRGTLTCGATLLSLNAEAPNYTQAMGITSSGQQVPGMPAKLFWQTGLDSFACRAAKLFIVGNGQGSPCLDLRRVPDTLADATVGADLVVLEGMGRSIITNYNTTFRCIKRWLIIAKQSWSRGANVLLSRLERVSILYITYALPPRKHLL